jgi:hypothetical protein
MSCCQLWVYHSIGRRLSSLLIPTSLVELATIINNSSKQLKIEFKVILLSIEDTSRIDQRSLMFYATTTKKCLPRIFVLLSHHIFIWVNMFWRVTYVLTRCHWHQPCSDTLSRHWNQLRWSWRGGAHAAAVAHYRRIGVRSLEQWNGWDIILAFLENWHSRYSDEILMSLMYWASCSQT